MQSIYHLFLGLATCKHHLWEPYVLAKSTNPPLPSHKHTHRHVHMLRLCLISYWNTDMSRIICWWRSSWGTNTLPMMFKQICVGKLLNETDFGVTCYYQQRLNADCVKLWKGGFSPQPVVCSIYLCHCFISLMSPFNGLCWSHYWTTLPTVRWTGHCWCHVTLQCLPKYAFFFILYCRSNIFFLILQSLVTHWH